MWQIEQKHCSTCKSASNSETVFLFFININPLYNTKCLIHLDLFVTGPTFGIFSAAVQRGICDFLVQVFTVQNENLRLHKRNG